MAKAGLSFENPLFQKSGGGSVGTYVPFAPPNTASATGVGSLQSNLADLSTLGELGAGMARTNQFTMPQMRKPPAIAFSPGKNQFFVQGQTFAGDDFASALQSEALLNQPGVDLPQGEDWIEIDPESYSGLLKNIREPSLGTLASKSFGRGVDVSQALVGRGLQLAGAEELGGRIVSAQEEELRKTSPFERQFTDIESGRDAVEWFVANFAQQGPNMIESVLTAGLGFLAGSAAGGPLAGAGGALAGLMGKTAFKESVKAAAKKQAAGQALSAAETKLLREAAGIAGAVSASYAQNIATGAADIYGELRDAGADANDVDARIKALAGSLPYAALETLPEYLLASRILAGTGAPRAIPAGTSIGRRGAELLRRGGVGFGVGGLAEGTTELGQEALVLGISGQDIGSDEAVNRLINSFAAGFGVGGAIGGAANLRGAEPANLLNPGQTTEPAASTTTTPKNTPAPAPRLPLVVAPGTQGDLFGGVGPVSPIPGLAGGVEGIPGVAGQYTPVGGFGVAPATEVPITQQDLFATDVLQGDMFGGPQVPREYPGELPPELGMGEVPVLPGQLPFQFAPPAPTGMRFTEAQPVPETDIARQLEALRRQAEFDQAMVQRREAEFTQAEAQRQLQLGQPPAQPTGVIPARPPREFGPTEPQQLSLFGPRELPRPSGAERLRRGATPLPETGPTVPVTPRESLQVAGQLPMFTQAGEPTVAALKGAGLRRKIVPVEEKGGTQIPPTGRNVTPASIAKARERVRYAKDVDESYDNGDRYVGRVDKDGARNGVGTYTYADGTVSEGTFKDGLLVKGKTTLPDGTVMDGTFEDADFREGTQTDPDGKVFRVENGEIVEDITPKPKEAEPVEITLELEDGGRMTVKDGRKLLDRFNKDIRKYEQFLACLTRK